jgi:hypothetical protein
MSKQFSKERIQRMRNLVSGNYNATTRVQTGFVVKKSKHVEGDVWEESNKTWTIKNGIKQTVNKLDEARKAIQIPLTCPKCEDPRMTHPAYKKIYRKFGFCPNCLAKFEKDLRSAGKYDEYVNKINQSSNEAWIHQMTEEYQEFLNGMDANRFITEAGDIEEWTGGESKESLETKFEARKLKVKEELKDEHEHSK